MLGWMSAVRGLQQRGLLRLCLLNSWTHQHCSTSPYGVGMRFICWNDVQVPEGLCEVWFPQVLCLGVWCQSESRQLETLGTCFPCRLFHSRALGLQLSSLSSRESRKAREQEHLQEIVLLLIQIHTSHPQCRAAWIMTAALLWPICN